MEFVKVKTNIITIYVGLKDIKTGSYADEDIARELCKEYCDTIGQCVSFTKTEYIYTNGSEPGVIVGFINYPRFPLTENVLLERALTLATILKSKLKQCKVSVVTPTETIMITGD